jgi:GNAT superfamily N-acetyltransferase
MRVEIDHQLPTPTSYRAARTASLFNAEGPPNFHHVADLDIEDDGWKIGVVVGPSGSGKSSIGRALWGGAAFHDPDEGWPTDRPIVDAIDPDGDFNAVTAALGAVGLGDVPAWLRPYHVLSNGEKFRADLARVVAEAPKRVVLDEFSSVVDRQIAQVGAGAFAKSWRRTGGQAVLLSCHYDILDWLEPDWVYDTRDGLFTRGSVQHRRLRIEVEIREGGWDLWPLFEPHHYLKVPRMVGAGCYVAFVDGDPVAHLAVGTKSLATKGATTVEARACRLVVMPEWQGAGVGMRFLNHVCQIQLDGQGRIKGRRMTSLFHTSHPQLCAALRRDPKWVQVSAVLHGANKAKSSASLRRTSKGGIGSGFGGHFRAVQGFRYVGVRP